MTIELPAPNRSTRREAGRRQKNRKQGLAAISLLATTGLMSSYIASIRTAPSFAFEVPGSCAEDLSLTGTVGELNTALLALITTLQRGECVTITIPAGVDDVDTTLTIPDFSYGGVDIVADVYIIGQGIEGNPTELNGGDDTRILETHENTFITNVTFSEGYTSSEGDGAAIYATKDLTVLNSVFSDNESLARGGAIYTDGEITVTSSVFTRNYAYDNGGAIIGDDNLTVTSSTFTSKVVFADDGGAIFADDNLTVTSSTFTENLAGYQGGAIWAYDDATITGSTFTSNETYSDAGGAIWAHRDLTVTSSTFTSNRADGDDGGAINADERVIIWDSTFVGNFADSDGGALDIGESSQVSNSVFRNNTAEGDTGGAIDVSHDSSIFGSTFIGNVASSEGGAVSMSADGSFVNSTFEGNVANEGGAIRSYEGVTIAFNTFVDNSATSAGNSWWSEDESAGSRVIVGNIFASSANSEAHLIMNDPSSTIELDYNLSTGDDFTAGSTNSTVTYSRLGLAAEPALNSSTRETVAISSASAAADFVPLAGQSTALSQSYGSLITFGDPAVPRDQRGVARVGAFDAGSFEVGVATGGTPAPVIGTGPALPAFSVATVQPEATGGSVIKVSGANLTRVVEVFVNGQKVRVLSSSRNSLTFTAPAGVSGALDIRFVGFEYEITVRDAMNLSSSTAGQVVLPASAEIVVPGFRANSTKLTRPMRKAIRKFVRANADLSTVTCRGFTSAPATPQDMALARKRGKVTCDFIKKINPDLTVKVLRGSHTDTPGKKIRRVRLVMN